MVTHSQSGDPTLLPLVAFAHSALLGLDKTTDRYEYLRPQYDVACRLSHHELLRDPPFLQEISVNGGQRQRR
jgi:hypothetical protein